MNAWVKKGNIRGAAGGTFPDAPPDGTIYGRRNSAWEQVATPADLQLAVEAEEAERIAADEQLSDDIAAEEAARITADGVLQTNIDTEEADRIAADATLQTNIDAKAPLASPALTGNPTTPTPTAGDNDTSIANTAFVTAADAAATGSGSYTNKATIVDADILAGWDSAAGFNKARWTFANFKAVIYTALGAIIAAATNKATLVDADKFLVADSAASNANKHFTWANLKTGVLAVVVATANLFTARQVYASGTTGNNGMATATANLGEIEVRGNGTGAANMAFHRPSAYAAYFGIDTDNAWKVGGWSATALAYRIITEAVEAVFTGAGFLQQAQVADAVVANAYTPAVTGKGNMRYVHLAAGTAGATAWTFNAPPSSGPSNSHMFTMVVGIYNAVASGAITFTGFTKVSGDSPNLALGKSNICYITRMMGQTFIYVDAGV